MMARKGDMVTPTLSTLMSLHFRDHNDNRRVYTSDVQNANQQIPMHIVSMNKKCAQNIIQILAKDMPTCMKAGTDDGSLPIHLACQYSYDPTLLATLLYYDKVSDFPQKRFQPSLKIRSFTLANLHMVFVCKQSDTQPSLNKNHITFNEM